ncbi:hypothetical protein [Streptomyces sp. NPDC006668]|uniref:hypothetical protein n=1 Tax=Streptomyces sp. NPDC006668 TaxID=3156903 RepID=UPI0033BFE264
MSRQLAQPRRRRKSVLAVGALIAAPLLLAATACGSEGTGAQSPATSAPAKSPPATHTSAPAGPAQKLAALDGGLRPAEQYQQVLDALAPRCAEDRPHLTTVVDTTRKALRKKGVDEDEFGVLQKLETWVPSGEPRTNCASRAASYVAQQEQNQ